MRDDFPHVAVLALEVEAPALVLVVDLAVRARAGPTAVHHALILDASQDLVELLVGGEERVVVGARLLLAFFQVIEVEGELVVDLHRSEVAVGAVVREPEHPRDELGGLHLVVSRDDRVVQLKRHD